MACLLLASHLFLVSGWIKSFCIGYNEYALESPPFLVRKPQSFGSDLYIPMLLNSSLTRPASGAAGEPDSCSSENAIALSVIFSATPSGPGTTIEIIEAPFLCSSSLCQISSLWSQVKF